MELKAILAIGLSLFIAGGAVFLFIRKQEKAVGYKIVWKELKIF